MRNPQLGESLNLHGYETYTAMAPVATNVGQRNARFIVLYDSTHAWPKETVSDHLLLTANFIVGWQYNANPSEKPNE